MVQTKYDVFISYSRKDYVDEHQNIIPGNDVSKIKEALTKAGIKYWFDEDGIYSGNNFTDKIVANIDASAIFLFLSTQKSNASPWTSREIACADELKKYIIPVRIDHSPYNRTVLLRIADRSYIDYESNPEKGLLELISSIKKHLEQQKAEMQIHDQIAIDIKLSCQELNNEEAKLELERANLLLRVEKVKDKEEKEALKNLINEGGTIHQKYQKKYAAVIKERDDLLAERVLKDEKIASLLSELDEANTRITALEKANIKGVIAPLLSNGLTNNMRAFDANGVSFNMIYVKGGSFMMGATAENACDDEKPVHQVSLSDFFIGETPVTQALWEAVMENNPSKFKDPDAPVESVTWRQCQEFINKLICLTKMPFRFLTEAEWEFAARGGCESKGFIYSGSNDVKSVAWCTDNSGERTHPVKQKESNELGIYDMSGNVWEWCQDYYGRYSSEDAENPTGPVKGSFRVQRGGCWDVNVFTGSESCRVSYRSSDSETYSSKRIGFRLALNLN